MDIEGFFYLSGVTKTPTSISGRRTAVEAARLAPSAVNRQPWRFRMGENRITLISNDNKKSHGVSPFLDCGIALLHLIVGAGVHGVKLMIKYGESPIIAKICIQE